MLKNNKGITMVALAIIIIVMIIISGVIIYEGTSTINSAKKQSINTNMLLIQAKARTIQEKKEFGEADYIGTAMEEEEKNEIGATGNVYKLSQENLYTIGLEISGNNKYAVDYEQDEVYYLDGIEDKQGNRYYSLTEISNTELDEE